MAGSPKKRARREAAVAKAALEAAAESDVLQPGQESSSAESGAIVGRPSLFSEELAAELLESLADGRTLKAICRQRDMPSERTVRRWAYDDPQGFGLRYETARKLGAHAMFDEAVDTVRDATSTTASEVQLARVKAEALMKAAGKLDPDTYGDRQRIDMNMASLPEDLDKRYENARALEAAARGLASNAKH